VRGLGPGKTVALDNETLRSERLKLVGRPDRIVKDGEFFIPEEWKSAKRVSHGHRLQVITYCILIEEKYGKRPPYGVVVNDRTRVVVENTEALRSEVLAIAEQIRKRRRALGEEIEVPQPLAKCRACGHRGNCEQASRYWQGEQLLRAVGREVSH
jgi:CRISPR-associated exonuclease Cas4